jgi:hypothetical protein
MKLIKSIIFLVVACISFSQCVKSIRSVEVGPADAKQSIVIAARYSDYKDSIVQGLVNRFKNAARVTVIPLSKVETVDTRKYNAVVIVDELLAWKMFNYETGSFINTIKDPVEKKKIVLFMTAGKPSKNYSFLGVDCITAASQQATNEAIVDEIAAKIKGVLR